jgi:hypothetical protein
MGDRPRRGGAGLWCRLDAGPGHPYELRTAVLEHFDAVLEH